MVKQVHMSKYSSWKNQVAAIGKNMENGFFPGQGNLLLSDQEKLEKLKTLMAMVVIRKHTYYAQRKSVY